MQKYIPILKQFPLFQGIQEEDLAPMLTCLNSRAKGFSSNSVILLADDPISSVGVILSGTIQVIKEDAFGNQNLINELSQGDLFGEAFICAGLTKSPVTVLAVTPSTVLFIDYHKLISTCTSACMFHGKLIENMLRIIGQKNILLNQKIDLLSRRTLREKLLVYFQQQVQQSSEKTFTIPFTRDELANYLCVNRSALSRELSFMKQEGLITFTKNQFTLHQ